MHKTNVLTFAGDLWQRTFDTVAEEYPGVTTAYQHVDAACIYMVQDPHRYDVIVTDNLFGDILTDLAGAVSGGIGAASSANLNPEDRTGPSMFEPARRCTGHRWGGTAHPRGAASAARCSNSGRARGRRDGCAGLRHARCRHHGYPGDEVAAARSGVGRPGRAG